MPDLTKATTRAKLKVRREPYWAKVGAGAFLGYRRMSADTSGQWIARYRDRGAAKQQYRPLGDFATYAESDRYGEALKAAMVWFSHLDRGGTATLVTMRDVCERYIEHVRQTRGSVACKDVERRIKSYVLSFESLATLDATKLTASHIDRWRRWIIRRPTTSGPNRGEQRSDSTLNRDLTVLRSALNLALADGLLTTDAPWKKRLAPIKGADRRREVFLTQVQQSELIRSLRPEFQPFFTVLSLLPIRPGAAAGLKVGDLDRELKTLRIDKDKSGADRLIALPSPTYLILESFAQGKSPDDPLTGTPNGRHWSRHQWKKAFREAVERGNLPEASVAYSMRHGNITALLHQGVDHVTVSHLGGTSLRMISQHYAHATDERARVALAHLVHRRTDGTSDS